jgi:hypothetical protein
MQIVLYGAHLATVHNPIHRSSPSIPPPINVRYQQIVFAQACVRSPTVRSPAFQAGGLGSIPGGRIIISNDLIIFIARTNCSQLFVIIVQCVEIAKECANLVQ